MELFYGCLFMACILYLVYVTYRMVNLNLHFLSFFNLKNPTVEGLENEDDDSGGGSTVNPGLGGGGANAQMYASKIKLASNRLRDKLSIATNRAAMEDLVYALDEYVGFKMVEVCTTALVGGDEFQKKMTELNAYNDAKTSLSTAIKIVDNTT